ncbi:MAG TPA: hypothetical protein VF947_00400, partial [Myxococcales bacterium]
SENASDRVMERAIASLDVSGRGARSLPAIAQAASKTKRRETRRRNRDTKITCGAPAAPC